MHIKSEYNCSDLLTKHWGYNVVWKHILQPLFHYAGNTANLMYDDTLLVDISIDKLKPSSIFNGHGEYEILQEAMKEGLRMSGWRAPNLCEQEKIWTKNEWMNECNYRLKKIVIVINDTSSKVLGRAW